MPSSSGTSGSLTLVNRPIGSRRGRFAMDLADVYGSGAFGAYTDFGKSRHDSPLLYFAVLISLCRAGYLTFAKSCAISVALAQTIATSKPTFTKLAAI